MLLETITTADVQIAVQASHWEDAIRKAARPLLENGAITSAYVEEMIQSLHKNGPYFVLTKGIALAHARPECGVNRGAVSFTTLKPGVPFGSEENDPVELIITLAATDSESHLNLLTELADVMMDEARLEQLFAAPTPEAFCTLLRG